MQLTLEALRVNAGMTQQDVADRLGVSRQTVIKWENGYVEPKELVIYALAKLYNVELDMIRVPFSA
jgi:transcriptional regulator with XRE-family HTH domain